MKSIEIIKGNKTYAVKLEREKADNIIGIAIRVFYDNKNVMNHFLDFSKHPAEEIEQNIIKFSDSFNENEASQWVDGYLEGKR